MPEHVLGRKQATAWSICRFWLIYIGIVGITVKILGCGHGREQEGEPASPSGPAASKVLDERVAKLSDPSVEVRRQAADALSKQPNPEAVSALAKALKDPDPRVRDRAAYAIVKHAPNAEAAIPALVEALDSDTRTYAGSALSLMGQRSAPALMTALSHKNATIRAGAATALMYLKPPAPKVAQAVARLLEDRDSGVRLAAIGSLSWMKEDAAPAVPALIKCMKDKDKWVRSAAGQALATLGPIAKDATGDLAGLLTEKDHDTRRHAVLALRAIGPFAAAALPALRRGLSQEDDPELKMAFAVALKQISKVPVPEAEAVYASSQVDENGKPRSPLAKDAGAHVGSAVAATQPEAVQSIAAFTNFRGKLVTWKGRVVKGELVRGESTGSTTYEVTVKLKAGTLPAPGSDVLFSGLLSPSVGSGTDFVYSPNGKATPITTVYLTVTDAVIVEKK